MLQDILDPTYIFFIGLAILITFFWYFATDKQKKKKLIGTVLTLMLSVFCLLCFIPPQKYVKLGMDLSGGVRFTLNLSPPEGRELNPDSIKQAIGILQKRLNARGTSDVRITRAGNERIIVDIPNRGKQKIDNEELGKIERTLTEKAILNFYLEHEQGWRNRTEFSQEKLEKIFSGEEIAPPNSKVLRMKPRSDEEGGNQERFILVHKYPDVKGKWVSRAGPYFGNEGWQIQLKLSGEGADKFFEISRRNVNNGRRLAIVLDDLVLSALGFRDEIPGGNCQISGDFTQEEAASLSSAMTNPLETPVDIIFKEFFPAELGKAAIKQGLYAGIVGLSFTILFILFYYRFAGLVALIGLTVNMIMLFGLMAIFQFDFTLPGIAGVILTLGIAIDSNVLIYERLREEKLAGKSLSAAIKSAYAKAFSAIFDANITTLISGAILFALATGAVKGFAVTLMIGITVSMFSALLVTRICFSWLVDAKILKNLNFFSLLKKPQIDFLKMSKKTWIISVILIITSVATIAIKRSDGLGIEFVGGESIKFQAKSADHLDVEKVRKAIADVKLDKKASVSMLKPLGASEEEFYSIRVERGKGKEIISALQKNLKGKVESFASTEISGVIAGEMLKKSIYSLLIALILIMFYLAIRFEFSFSLGASIALFHDLLIALGIIYIFGFEMSLVMIGAFLTIAGYSINDTIVVFDRIRENLQTKKGNLADLMNQAINSTLSRTILTSLTTLITVICLFAFGGPSLRDFAFAIIVGVLIGTYSSIFVASPVVLWWSSRTKTDLRQEVSESEAINAKNA